MKRKANKPAADKCPKCGSDGPFSLMLSEIINGEPAATCMDCGYRDMLSLFHKTAGEVKK